MNIQQALQQASQKLSASSPSAALDAQILLSHILQCNSAHLAAWPEKNLSEQQQADYQQLITQRQQGVPVAHLTGLREFWSLDFTVNDSTLIPRPETETLVDFILTKFSASENLSLLDLGTGTGAIAISIAKQRPNWQITATDISQDALKLARKNSDRQQTRNVKFIHSDWFENIEQNAFDIIVSNPPYIAENDPHLQQGDVRFEPHSALTSGETGMNAIEHLCLHAKDYLKQSTNKKAWLIIEHGYNQQQQVADCFTRNAYTEITQIQDLSGHTRMTAGCI